MFLVATKHLLRSDYMDYLKTIEKNG